MRNLKMITVLGARPQFVKAALVSREMKLRKVIDEIIVHTGQHFDENMSDIFFTELNIPQPHYNLQIHGLPHASMIGRMMEGIEPIIEKEKPDLLMVYGDANSTLAGALAAKKMKVKLAHVEAGLRSFNNEMPEEINRILTDRVSDILFCPTDTAVQNLKKEGFENSSCKIIKVGDVMQDAALFYTKQSAKESKIISQLNLENKKFVLCTIHRQENTDVLENLNAIIRGLNKISAETLIVFPAHPRIQQILKREKIPLQFTTIAPIGYLDMVALLKQCSLVITDSGGLQKEAFFFKKHCIIVREQTEWLELIDHGFSTLVGTDETKMFDAYKILCTKEINFNVDLYGKGKACERIVDELLEIKK